MFAQSDVDSIFYDAFYKFTEASEDSLGNQFIDVYSYNIEYFQIIPEKKLLRARTKIKVKSEKNLNSFYLDFHNSFKVLLIII